MGATTVMAVAAVGSLALGVYSATANQPSAPPPPPPPAGSYQYDEYGNLLTVQYWDPEKNAYVTKFDPEPDMPKSPDPYYGAGAPPKKDSYVLGTKYANIPSAGYGQKTSTSEFINVPDTPENRQKYGYEGPKGDPRVAGGGVSPGGVQIGGGTIKVKNPDYQAPMTYEEAYAAWQQKYEAGKEAYKQQLLSDPNSDYAKQYTAWKARQDDRQHEADLRKELRLQMLGNLSETPEDRIAAYDNYAKAFSEQMHRDVDPQYEKYVRATNESMAARGLTGSRASVDLAAETQKNKTFADTDIAEKATLAKEGLAQADKNQWLGILNSLDAGGRADAALASQNAYTANNIANSANAQLLARYAAAQNAYGFDVAKNSALTNAGFNAAGGLGMAYLYGKNGGSIPGYTSKMPSLMNDYATAYNTAQNNFGYTGTLPYPR
jgi:hypothetical protein